MPEPTYPVKQIVPPLPPRETLPTMYDLPSENPEEPGLPDEYHDLQPQLLSRTFRCPCYLPEQMFAGTDLNLYFDTLSSEETEFPTARIFSEGIDRQWLRWYDERGNWIPTDTEQERQEKQQALLRAERAESQLQLVVLNLLQQGMTVEQVARITEFSEEQVQRLSQESRK